MSRKISKKKKKRKKVREKKCRVCKYRGNLEEMRVNKKA